jgi:hypothetical protein
MRNETRAVPIAVALVAAEEAEEGQEVTFVVSRIYKGLVTPKWADEDDKAEQVK